MGIVIAQASSKLLSRNSWEHVCVPKLSNQVKRHHRAHAFFAIAAITRTFLIIETDAQMLESERVPGDDARDLVHAAGFSTVVNDLHRFSGPQFVQQWVGTPRPELTVRERRGHDQALDA